jgi:hypothetical protein
MYTHLGILFIKFCIFNYFIKRFEKIPWSVEKIDDYNELFKLIVELKKRPKILDASDDKITLYLINIMKKCWISEIHQRPKINEILFSMNSKLNQIEYFQILILAISRILMII